MSADNLEWRVAPTHGVRALIEDLDDDQLLVGPDRDPDEAEIDPIFATSYDQAVKDLRSDLGIGEDDEETFGAWIRTACSVDPLALSADGFVRIVPAVSDKAGVIGVVLADVSEDAETPRLLGAFTGPTLCLAPDKRGAGLGAALVAARLMEDEELPTWDHDTPGYSPAGAGAVATAARLVLDLAAEKRFETPSP